MPEHQPPRRRGDPVTALILAGVLALAAGGYFVFPWLLHKVQHMDCIAAGRVSDC